MPEVDNLFHDQIITISNIRNADMNTEDGTSREEGKGKGKDNSPKHVMKKRKAGQPDRPEEALPVPQQGPDLSRPLKDSQLPPASAIRVGAEYPPNVFPDYGGPGFHQRLAKAKQPNVRDEGGALIPIWQFYDRLRVGTLVMANVIVMVWVIQNKGSTIQKALAALNPVNMSAPDASAVIHDNASAALQSLVIPGFTGGKEKPDNLSDVACPSVMSDTAHPPSSPVISASMMTSSPLHPASPPESVAGSSTGPGTIAGRSDGISQDFDMLEDIAMLTDLDDEDLQVSGNNCPKKKTRTRCG
ncbi:hypothetical protein PM082_024968 [Marasmius tenuissimus]|nr:hypothetical protein PM082_024968 [Marasmius tenuissimus]